MLGRSGALLAVRRRGADPSIYLASGEKALIARDERFPSRSAERRPIGVGEAENLTLRFALFAGESGGCAGAGRAPGSLPVPALSPGSPKKSSSCLSIAACRSSRIFLFFLIQERRNVRGSLAQRFGFMVAPNKKDMLRSDATTRRTYAATCDTHGEPDAAALP